MVTVVSDKNDNKQKDTDENELFDLLIEHLEDYCLNDSAVDHYDITETENNYFYEIEWAKEEDFSDFVNDMKMIFGEGYSIVLTYVNIEARSLIGVVVVNRILA